LNATVTYTEEELIQLLKGQSRQAFNYLYTNYAPALYGVIYKVLEDEQTSQDVLQDVFVKIWNNIAQYNPDKGRLYTWLLNIARNSAIDKTRSKGEIMKNKIQTGENVVHNLEQTRKTEVPTDTIGLRKMVNQLKPEYASIIDLAYFNGYTIEEISKTLNIPSGTVKTRMRSAIGQLREIYVIK
jgi:RNA polymerase sigma-70 factor (ECF subfamily)